MSYYRGWYLQTSAMRCDAVKFGVRMHNKTRDLVKQMIDQKEDDKTPWVPVLTARQIKRGQELRAS